VNSVRWHALTPRTAGPLEQNTTTTVLPVTTLSLDNTTDGGNTWISQQVPSGAYPYSLSSASCISTTDCWVTGRTDMGGVIINYGLSSNGTATSGSFDVTVTGTGGTDGVDSLSEAEYTGNPVGNLTDGNNYFDVAASPGNTFSSVVIQDCNDVTASTSLDWWDPSANADAGGWEPVVGDPGPTYEPGTPPCLAVTLDGSSSPTPPRCRMCNQTVFPSNPRLSPCQFDPHSFPARTSSHKCSSCVHEGGVMMT
jgi:hypothetical protein